VASTLDHPDRVVQNTVINALLEALFDILDLDGKRSVLEFAGLEQWLEKLPQSGKSLWVDFLKLVSAMRTLLQYSETILFEVGKKFSIYLDPFGSSFPDFIKMLEQSLVDLHIEYQEISPLQYEITMKWTGQETDLLDDKWMQHFYRGIYSEGMRKAVGGVVKAVILSTSDLSIKLKIISLPQATNQ
jgi:hypothetical protein